jgi:hypothetical protein
VNKVILDLVDNYIIESYGLHIIIYSWIIWVIVWVVFWFWNSYRITIDKEKDDKIDLLGSSLIDLINNSKLHCKDALREILRELFDDITQTRATIYVWSTHS